MIGDLVLLKLLDVDKLSWNENEPHILIPNRLPNHIKDVLRSLLILIWKESLRSLVKVFALGIDLIYS